MLVEVTLSDGKKEFSFKVVGIDPKEFRQKMIDFVELDVNILLSVPEKKEVDLSELKVLFLQSYQRMDYLGVSNYFFKVGGTILKLKVVGDVNLLLGNTYSLLDIFERTEKGVFFDGENSTISTKSVLQIINKYYGVQDEKM